MFENFKKMVGYPICTDDQIHEFFFLLDPGDHVAALDLLEKNRPELAKRIAREILEAATAAVQQKQEG